MVALYALIFLIISISCCLILLKIGYHHKSANGKSTKHLPGPIAVPFIGKSISIILINCFIFQVIAFTGKLSTMEDIAGGVKQLVKLLKNFMLYIFSQKE